MDLEPVSPGRSRLGGPARWLLAVLTVGGLVMFCSAVAVTRSSWASGVVANSADQAATGSLAFTHTYAAGPTCSAGPGTTSVACTGTLTSGQVSGAASLATTDSIINNGNLTSSALTQSVAVSSCEPVSFANSRDAVNPLVDRYGTTFNQAGPFTGAGSVVFDGSTGYATSVVAQAQPPTGVLSAGQISGLGIWFKAASGTAGPLFSFDASASNGGGSVDRTLYLNAAGQLTFIWNASGSSIGPTTTSGGYANGAWHFAFITLGGVSVALIGLIPQVALYVDGTQVVSTPLISLSPFTSFSGYWHVGYAPVATTGLTTAYFSGSLSNFVVMDSPSFSDPTSYPNSAIAFSVFSGNATERWQLNDTGTTTFTGTLPTVGAGSATASAACKSVDLGWSFTSPTGTATSSATSLFAWVAGTSAVSAPAAGTTQSATLTLSHDTSYNSYVAGLHLWVPMTSTISATPGLQWGLTFSWTPAAGSTIIPTA